MGLQHRLSVMICLPEQDEHTSVLKTYSTEVQRKGSGQGKTHAKEKHARDNGTILSSEKSRYRYFSVSLYRKCCQGLEISLKKLMNRRNYQEKRFHLVLMPCWNFVHIDYARISSRVHLAVFLDGLEYLPSILPVHFVASQPESDKERLDRLRSETEGSQHSPPIWLWRLEQAYLRMYLASSGGYAPGLSIVDTAVDRRFEYRYNHSTPCTLDVPVMRHRIHFHPITWNPEMHNLGRQAAVPSTSVHNTAVSHIHAEL